MSSAARPWRSTRRVLGLATARLLADALTARAASTCAPISTCSTRSGASVPACRAAPVFEHAAPYASQEPHPASWPPPAPPWPPLGAEPPFHFHAGRHRLAVQPARRRRQLQPGVPGARADRSRPGRHPVHRPTTRSPAELRRRLMDDGVTWRRTTDAADGPGRPGAGDRAAGRPAPDHGRHARGRARAVRVVEAVNPSTLAKSQKGRAQKRPMCAPPWSRTAPPCANSSRGSSGSWPTRRARR